MYKFGIGHEKGFMFKENVIHSGTWLELHEHYSKVL